ncbi:hypothetical protein [Sphingomicrobium nitratireducens]|uniref:hypothetical protein n=1 Tax=Sphingomicrobium nitratireducens TaxID=2964666 RepID=UPI0022405231|nr:hypothetical protein [Sphingomicrobium nitratireducens]
MLLTLMALLAAEPDAEALALGRELSELSTLGTMMPIMEMAETEALVAEHPELDDAERAELRAVAHETYLANRDAMLDADARAHAEILSKDDMRVLVTFARTGPAMRLRAASGSIAARTMEIAGEIDFKQAVRAEYCVRSGKLCEEAPAPAQ